MSESYVIEVDGIFLGTALCVPQENGRVRFYATHESVRDLHLQEMAHLPELRRQVAVLSRRGMCVA
ncbi:hypothetical protein LOC54_01775 [Acetobacter sp. AN02]|uniref:hypothetical protein n=1 Tax=Acetobacter sp. AN02 TaxID=2894186 RepID=UPI002434203E|nr:hypothetical protein [Acetobacter sp. AN02]MDG6093852.1 hypothetical protein [Acetobacter sp. AN02]